jgi:hypothetical protein
MNVNKYLAYRHTGRYLYTWFGFALYAMIVSTLCYAHQFFDNQWHAQGLLTYLGGRAPQSAIFGIQQFAFYTAYIFVMRYFVIAINKNNFVLKNASALVGTRICHRNWGKFWFFTHKINMHFLGFADQTSILHHWEQIALVDLAFG